MKQLTKAEEEVMQVLWELKEASVKDIIGLFPVPKPAYNTVSTIIRILETKKFVEHRQEGKGYIYFPIVKKTEYSNSSLNRLVENYFQGSFKNMVSFFVKKNNIDLEDVEFLLKEIKKQKDA
ncbi:CopY family transcriptional repressor [Flavobacterium sp. 9AF]|uniref:BlaI/MecI/CopY family transcriptional regulator n=1 Tax=Flavobacterium sp. 9AF TaxID=2653142 RepID=UPI0012EF9E12|nr:BlaI/MecI/CopY family transcriptional regulator [Flavobacterium sp. 9AF]VXB22210.1 CopY family transcriptional repressor [Flavobacterium sp. 9AF]